MCKNNKTFADILITGNQGFTILEFLIVLTVLFTLTAGMLKVSGGFQVSNPVDDSRKELRRVLSYTRSRAVAEGKSFHIKQMSGGRLGILNPETENVEEIIELEDGVTGQINGWQNKIMFSRLGTVNGSNVELMDKRGKVLKLIVSPGGSIR